MLKFNQARNNNSSKSLFPCTYGTRYYSAPIILKQGNLEVQALAHAPRNKQTGKPFTQQIGTELGITYSNSLTPGIFLDPLFLVEALPLGISISMVGPISPWPPTMDSSFTKT